MEAAAHTKGGFGGVPQKVGKEFVQADKGKNMKTTKKAMGGSLDPMNYDSDVDYYESRQKAGLPARPRGYTKADRDAIINAKPYKAEPYKAPVVPRRDPEKERTSMESIERSLASMRATREADATMRATRKAAKKLIGKKSGGLYENINAKRERIANGSGEKMRKVGAPGAPTKQDFKESAKTAKMKSGGKTTKSCW
jgi:hypothetical protein